MRMNELFLQLLREVNSSGRSVSDKRSSAYAPAVFEKTPKAVEAKATKAQFEKAMERLFAADRLTIVTEGPPSKRRTRIVDASNGHFQHPSNTLPTGCSHTPL